MDSYPPPGSTPPGMPAGGPPGHSAVPPSGQPGMTASGPSSRRRTGLVAGAVAAALVVAGGAFAATRVFGGTGGGQPADVLPGEALGYLRIDLDPSVGQKVAAFRLLDKLPEAKQALTDSDPKRALFGLLQKDNPDLKDIDYRNDIEPWLGERAGIAILPPAQNDKQPPVAIAVQVKDEDKATAGLAKLKQTADRTLNKLPRQGLDLTGNRGFGSYTAPSATLTSESSPSGTGSGSAGPTETVHFFRDGYVILTDKAHEQTVRGAMDRGNLSARGEFADDMKAVGDQGVLSGWLDQRRFIEAALQASPQSTTPDQQRVFQELLPLMTRQSMAVRFNADFVEAASFSRGNPLGLPSTAVKDLGALPASTAVLVSFSNGDAYLGKMWDLLRKLVPASGSGDFDSQLRQLEASSGLRLPDDLQTLLGKQFDLVMSDQLTQGEQRLPKLGVRVQTDTAKAQTVLDRIMRLIQQQGGTIPQLPQSSKDGRFYLALEQSYLDELTQAGSFGQAAALATAVPELTKATSVLYADLDKLEPRYLDSVPQEHRDLVRSLRAVGMATVPADDGSLTTVRLLAN